MLRISTDMIIGKPIDRRSAPLPYTRHVELLIRYNNEPADPNEDNVYTVDPTRRIGEWVQEMRRVTSGRGERSGKAVIPEGSRVFIIPPGGRLEDGEPLGSRIDMTDVFAQYPDVFKEMETGAEAQAREAAERRQNKQIMDRRIFNQRVLVAQRAGRPPPEMPPEIRNDVIVPHRPLTTVMVYPPRSVSDVDYMLSLQTSNNNVNIPLDGVSNTSNSDASFVNLKPLDHALGEMDLHDVIFVERLADNKVVRTPVAMEYWRKLFTPGYSIWPWGEPISNQVRQAIDTFNQRRRSNPDLRVFVIPGKTPRERFREALTTVVSSAFSGSGDAPWDRRNVAVQALRDDAPRESMTVSGVSVSANFAGILFADEEMMDSSVQNLNPTDVFRLIPRLLQMPEGARERRRDQMVEGLGLAMRRGMRVNLNEVIPRAFRGGDMSFELMQLITDFSSRVRAIQERLAQREERAEEDGDRRGQQAPAPAAAPAADARQMESALFRAAAQPDVLAMRDLIARGVNVNATNPLNLFTPLMVAADKAREVSAQILIEAGANVNARTRSGYTPLYFASRAGNLPIVRMLLRNGANSNAATDTGTTPIFNLTEGSMQVVRELINYGARVNHASNVGYTPLMRAAGDGYLGVVRVLLLAGANPNARTNTQWTPLMAAVRSTSSNAAQITSSLLEFGADPDAVRRNNEETVDSYATPITKQVLDNWRNMPASQRTATLQSAATRRDANLEIIWATVVQNTGIQQAQAQAQAHAQPAQPPAQPQAPAQPPAQPEEQVEYNALLQRLKDAIQASYSNATRSAIEAGADVNAPDNSGMTPLMVAANRGQLAIGRVLLEHGARINAVTNNGRSVFNFARSAFREMLHEAQWRVGRDMPNPNPNPALLQRLQRSYGFHQVNYCLLRGTPPPIQMVFRAIDTKNVKLLIRLVATGGNIDELWEGVNVLWRLISAVHWSSSSSSLSPILRTAIALGGDVNFVRNGRSVLNLALSHGTVEAVRDLLHAGANPYLSIPELNVNNDRHQELARWRETPRWRQHQLEKEFQTEMEQIRQQCRADIQRFDQQRALYDSFKSMNMQNANTQMLRNNVGYVNQTLDSGETLLHIAVENSDPPFIIFLLENGANPNAQDAEGNSALALACKKGFHAIVELLLAYDADPNSINGDFKTPIYHVIESESITPAAKIDVVRFLLKAGADPMFKYQSITPVTLATRGGLTQVRNALRSWSELSDARKAEEKANFHQTRQPTGRTPPAGWPHYLDQRLFSAIRYGNTTVVDEVIREMRQLNRPMRTPNNEDGFNTVQYAAMLGRTECLKRLIVAGFDLDYRNTEEGRNTALHLAAIHGRGMAYMILLHAGASTRLTNSSGHSVSKAAEESDWSLIQAFRDHFQTGRGYAQHAARRRRAYAKTWEGERARLEALYSGNAPVQPPGNVVQGEEEEEDSDWVDDEDDEDYED